LSHRRLDDPKVAEHIASSVDEAVADMLGDAVVDAFYVHLNEKGVTRKDLGSKVKLLCTILDDTFGIQSRAIQRNIAKKLFSRLGLDFQPVAGDEKSLPDFIRDANKLMMAEA